MDGNRADSPSTDNRAATAQVASLATGNCGMLLMFYAVYHRQFEYR
jgi:hypothetical protein